MRNRRRVVYYAILLLLILGEILGEINYIIIIFLEYDNRAMGRIQVLYRRHFWIGRRPLEEFPSIFMALRVERHFVV